MKILFWNVRGLGYRTKRKMVADICRTSSTNIFYPKEMKLSDPQINILGELNGNSQFECLLKNSNGASGGY